MLMLGVRQTFPAWGSLDARGRAAAEEAGSAQDAARARRQELAAQVRRTYAPTTAPTRSCASTSSTSG